MKNWYKKSILDHEEAENTCPSCGGTGYVSGGPKAPRPAKCLDCNGTGVVPKFSEGDRVVVNSKKSGMMEGVVSQVHEFYSGEWFYRVAVEEIQNWIIVRESEMSLS